jgi:hypothetical protein
MRNILHNWPDHKCIEILTNLASALAHDSVVLIDEMVLREREAPARSAQLDLAMMTCLAAMERTEAQWRSLLDAAGFQVCKIWKYTDECDDSVIVAVPK